MTSLDVRAIDESELKKAPRPKLKHELQVFLAEEAFDRAVERGTSDTTREIGGVLVGEVLRDDSGPYLRVDATIDALHAEEKGAELTFTHATWEHIHKEMDTTHKGKKVVGWYHTHPGFGVFLSDRDQFIHKSFFNLPFQVALVYDPKSKEHGVFAWRDNEVWRLRHYAIGGREHTWDGNRTTARPVDDKKPADDADRDDDRDRDRDRRRDRDDEGLGSLATFGLIAVLLMLIAGFGGHWLGMSAANQEVVKAQVAAVNAQEHATELAVGRLDNDLVKILRDTLADARMQAPVARALTELDAAIDALGALAPTPAAPPAPPAAGSGSGSGSAAAAPPAPPADPRTLAIARLKEARAAFAELARTQVAAIVTLDQIATATRGGAEERARVLPDLSAHRAAIGQLYAELATDVAKTDPARAARLLAVAAKVDARNIARYQAQLQTFQKGATLPRESGDTAEPAPSPEGGK